MAGMKVVEEEGVVLQFLLRHVLSLYFLQFEILRASNELQKTVINTSQNIKLINRYIKYLFVNLLLANTTVFPVAVICRQEKQELSSYRLSSCCLEPELSLS